MSPSHLRRDPISDRWVIIAAQRGERPQQYARIFAPVAGFECPFCRGREDQTPPVIASHNLPGAAGWQVRVVPNKYPALTPRADAPPRPTSAAPRQAWAGHGVHEVIIESPEHLTRLSELPPAGLELVFRAYRDRLRALAGDPGLRHALVFKNVGPEAGASLEHLHSQLLALPLTPPEVERELAGFDACWRELGSCLMCDLLAEEEAAGERVVASTARFVAFCPYASRFAYETWIAPRDHAAHYEGLATEAIAELAALVGLVIGRLDQRFNGPAYNYFLHSAPFAHTRDASAPPYHWHWEILPRFSRPAGWEWGTGCFLNAVAPETAAAALRQP